MSQDNILQKRSDARRWLDPLICILIFVLTLPFVYTLGISEFDAHHTGLMYKTALDVANGKILFLETFTQYGALTVYTQALFLLICGKKVTSIILATALFYAINYALLYRLSRRFFGRTLSAVTVVLTLLLAPYYFWGFHPWSSVFAITFMMLSLDFLLLSFEKAPSLSLLFTALSGLCAALSFWCRQPVGIVTALAGLLCVGFLAIMHRRHAEKRRAMLWRLLLFAAGTVVGVLALLIPLIAMGAYADFVHQSIKCMFSFASSRASSGAAGIFSTLSHMFYALVTSPFLNRYNLWIDPIWTILPLVALTFALGVAIRMIVTLRKNPEALPSPRDILLLVYGIYTVGNWHQYFPVACYRHWYWGSFFSIPVTLLFLKWGISKLSETRRFSFLKRPRASVLALPLAILIVFGSNVTMRVIVGTERLASMAENGAFEHPHYEHLNGVYMDEEVAEHFTLLFDQLYLLQQQFPDTNIINTTDNGIYAVFGENYCKLFNDSGDFYYPDYYEWRADYIASDRPIVIGPEAPDESYVLYFETPGDGGDVFAASHCLPANIYLPAELYAQLQ